MPSVERHEFRFPSRGRVNPALKEAADRNIDWMLRMRLLTADQIDDYRKAKYPSLAARFFPDASPEDLQVIVDLNGVSFMMDDLTESPGGIEHVTEVFEEFTRVMDAPDRTPSGVVMTAWKDLWSRLASPMSPAWRERSRRNWRACFDSFLQERRLRDEGRIARLPEYASIHRVTVGAYVYSDLAERAYRFEIDPFIEAMPAVQMLRWTAAEHIYQVNDLLSLEKDEETQDDNNLVRLLQRTHGYQRDDAIQLVLARCNSLVEDFQANHLILRNTIEYQAAQETERSAIDRFVDGLANLMIAATDWSYETGRYRAFDNEDQALPEGRRFSAELLRSL